MDRIAFEIIDRAGGQNLQIFLWEGRRLIPQECGSRLWISSDQAIVLAIDTDRAGQRLLGARPVPGGVIGQPIGARPDAEVGIMSDQGHCGRPQSKWFSLVSCEIGSEDRQ